MGKLRKKLLFLAMALVLVTTFLAGCGSKDQGTPQQNAGGAADKKLKVAFSISTLNNPYFVTVKEGAEAGAKEVGYDLVLADAQNDSNKQISDVENFISQKTDLIIINPVDSDAVVPAIQEANKAGIPVVTWNRKANGGEVAAHISFDEIKTGTMLGEYLAKALNGKGKVAELQGVMGTDVAQDRSKGFSEVLKNYPELKLVAQLSANFDRAQGMKVMEDILQANPDIDAVYAANDEMALGAISAIEAAGKLSKIKVLGVDATEEGLKALKEGKILADVSLPPYFFGKKALEVAKQVMDGTLKEKVIIVPSTLVTKENVETVKVRD